MHTTRIAAALLATGALLLAAAPAAAAEPTRPPAGSYKVVPCKPRPGGVVLLIACIQPVNRPYPSR